MIKTVLLPALTVLALAFVPAGASAEEAAAKSSVSAIGVVDVQLLMTESEAAKSVQAQLEKQRESFQSEISKYEREVKDLEAALVKAQADKKEDEFNKKRGELQKKAEEAKAMVNKRRQALEKATSDAMQSLRKEIVKISAEVAEKKKLDLIITRNNVVLATKDMDITDQVMTQLNKQMKDIKLKVETN